MDDRLEIFGNEVKRLRNLRGFSQDELAKKSGFQSRQAIQKIEKGRSDISIERLEDLSKALNVKPGYFLDIMSDRGEKITVEIEITDLSDRGIEMLKLYVESLRKIPGMTKED